MKPQIPLIVLLYVLIFNGPSYPMTVTSGCTGNIFTAGKPVVFDVKVEGDSNGAAGELSYRVADYLDRTIEQGSLKNLKDTVIRLKLPKSVGQVGKYLKLSLAYDREGANPDKKEVTFGILPEKPPVVEGEESPFGLSVGEVTPKDVDLARRIGVTWQCDYSGRDWVEKINAIAKFRYFSNFMQGRPELIMEYFPKKGEDPEGVWRGLQQMYGHPRWRNLEEYKNFVRESVAWYSGRMNGQEIFSIGHEVYYTVDSVRTKYVEMVKTAYTIAKEVNPKCKVYIGGLCTFDEDRMKSLFEELKDYSDGLDIHPWDENRSIQENRLKLIKKIYSDVYHRPVFIGETTSAGEPELSVAEDIPALYTLYVAYGMKFAVWLWFRDMEFEKKRIEPGFKIWNMCIMNYDFTPKMGYFSYYNMVCKLKNAKLIKEIGLNDKYAKCFLFERPGGNNLAVVWYEAPNKWSPVTEKDFNLKVNTKDVTVSDIMGNSETIQADKGVVSLKTVDRRPRYVEANGLDISE